MPSKVVLSFNVEEDAKDSLFCTQWRDEWPLEQLIQKLPIVSFLYSSLLVPTLTVVFLWASNLAFWLHAKVETVEHRYAKDATTVYRKKVEPRLPPSLVKGFDAGVHAAEHVGQHGAHIVSRVSRGPLTLVEELARTATVIVNLALPHQLQLPYPSVFAEHARVASVKASKAEKKEEKPSEEKPTDKPADSKSHSDNEGSQSPKVKVSGSPHVSRPDESQKDTVQTAADADNAANDEADKKRKADTQPANEEPRHAKVVIGASEDGSQSQAKEIDVVTQQVTEKESTEPTQPSLYVQLKKDDQLPGGGSSNGSSSGKKASGKKKSKAGQGRK